MKKIFFLSMFLLVTGIVAQAQSFTLGVKAGISSSSVDVKDPKGSLTQFRQEDNITGFHAGAFARVGLLGFMVQPEAVFSTSGGKVEFTDLAGKKSVQEVGFSHLDVPVLFGYSLFNIARVYAGPVASIMIDSDFGDREAEEYIDTADWGFQVGAGVDISRFTADVRYERLTRSYAQDANTADITGQQVILSLGFKLIGK